MSVATPTLIPRPQIFPRLLPVVPQTRPVPLPKGSQDVGYGHMNRWRNLQREMDDLSEEEKELEEISLSVQHRGFSFLVPIGKTLTVMEEKADEDESEESASAASGAPPSVMDDEGEGENDDSAQDLDASMEDLDEEAANMDDEYEERVSEEMEERPSETTS